MKQKKPINWRRIWRITWLTLVLVLVLGLVALGASVAYGWLTIVQVVSILMLPATVLYNGTQILLMLLFGLIV